MLLEKRNEKKRKEKTVTATCTPCLALQKVFDMHFALQLVHMKQQGWWIGHFPFSSFLH